MRCLNCAFGSPCQWPPEVSHVRRGEGDARVARQGWTCPSDLNGGPNDPCEDLTQVVNPSEGLLSMAAVELSSEGHRGYPVSGHRDRYPWGSTGGAGRWCCRWADVSRGCTDLRDGPAAFDAEADVLGCLIALVPGERAFELVRFTCSTSERRAFEAVRPPASACGAHDSFSAAPPRGSLSVQRRSGSTEAGGSR